MSVKQLQHEWRIVMSEIRCILNRFHCKEIEHLGSVWSTEEGEHPQDKAKRLLAWAKKIEKLMEIEKL